jgi:four helix bundle protein
MVAKSYEDLEIYQISHELAMKIHNMTLKLPNYEQYEEGKQIRKASKSIVANIVEGFGRRRYKNEFIKFLTYAHASCDVTKAHLKFIFDSGYVNEKEFKAYFEDFNKLGRKIHNFIKTVEKSHKT